MKKIYLINHKILIIMIASDYPEISQPSQTAFRATKPASQTAKESWKQQIEAPKPRERWVIKKYSLMG